MMFKGELHENRKPWYQINILFHLNGLEELDELALPHMMPQRQASQLTSWTPKNWCFGSRWFSLYWVGSGKSLKSCFVLIEWFFGTKAIPDLVTKSLFIYCIYTPSSRWVSDIATSRAKSLCKAANLGKNGRSQNQISSGFIWMIWISPLVLPRTPNNFHSKHHLLTIFFTQLPSLKLIVRPWRWTFCPKMEAGSSPNHPLLGFSVLVLGVRYWF